MNKVAVITGAARGIGKAIALKFASQGYHVVINYRGSEEKANAVKEPVSYTHLMCIRDRCMCMLDKLLRLLVQPGLEKQQLLNY